MGVTGVLMGILTILVIKEPERGRYDLMAAKTLEYSSDEDEGDIAQIDMRTKKKEKAMSAGEEFMESLTDVWKNPVAKWNTIAGMFRFFETFSIVYYLPTFMMKVYPAFKTQYGLYSALIVASCGFLSTVIGGLVSDKYEKKSRMTKALVCLLGGAFAIPAISICVLTTSNFWVSMAFMALKYLLSESWMSPAITMM